MNAAGISPVELLLVEDNPGDVRLFRKAMSKVAPFVQVTVAEDGEQAVELLRARASRTELPTLVVLDLNLPRMDGREVLKVLKTDADLLHLPVIVLTSSSNVSDVLASYRLHANCCVRKPVEFAELERLAQSLAEFWLGLVTLPPGR